MLRGMRTGKPTRAFCAMVGRVVPFLALALLLALSTHVNAQGYIRNFTQEYAFSHVQGLSQTVLVFWTARAGSPSYVDYAVAVKQKTGWVGLGYNTGNQLRYVAAVSVRCNGSAAFTALASAAYADSPRI